VRLLGLGTDRIQVLPVDADGRLVAEALQAKLEEDTDAPTLVLLQAGDVNIGAYDNFVELIPIAKQHGAWVHVHGANMPVPTIISSLRGAAATGRLTDISGSTFRLIAGLLS
jgi:selenocysteine lyase/cysteine desulfurase